MIEVKGEYGHQKQNDRLAYLVKCKPSRSNKIYYSLGALIIKFPASAY